MVQVMIYPSKKLTQFVIWNNAKVSIYGKGQNFENGNKERLCMNENMGDFLNHTKNGLYSEISLEDYFEYQYPRKTN